MKIENFFVYFFFILNKIFRVFLDCYMTISYYYYFFFWKSNESICIIIEWSKAALTCPIFLQITIKEALLSKVLIKEKILNLQENLSLKTRSRIQVSLHITR